MQEFWIPIDCKLDNFSVSKTKPKYIRDICLSVVVSINNVSRCKWHNLSILAWEWSSLGLGWYGNDLVLVWSCHFNRVGHIHETLITPANSIDDFYQNLKVVASPTGATAWPCTSILRVCKACETRHNMGIPPHLRHEAYTTCKPYHTYAIADPIGYAFWSWTWSPINLVQPVLHARLPLITYNYSISYVPYTWRHLFISIINNKYCSSHSLRLSHL